MLGVVFLWAFLDKLFGLGYSTEPGSGWISGGSPISGFLQFGATGPFAPLYASIGGTGVVDWLYMLALLLIGIALIPGIGMKIATISGTVLMLLLWSAVLPKENNIFFLMSISFIYWYLSVFIFQEQDRLQDWVNYGPIRLWSKKPPHLNKTVAEQLCKRILILSWISNPGLELFP